MGIDGRYGEQSKKGSDANRLRKKGLFTRLGGEGISLLSQVSEGDRDGKGGLIG